MGYHGVISRAGDIAEHDPAAGPPAAPLPRPAWAETPDGAAASIAAATRL
jgi:hypothetical protein